MWQELRTELHPKGLEVVTVALDVGGADVARPFIEAADPRHPSLVDVGHTLDEQFGVVNVPNGIWIDEAGVIVRPAEPAFPGHSPIMDQLRAVDLSALPPEVAEMLDQAQRIKTDPEGYVAAVRDWVEHGADSRFALNADEVVARSHPRSLSVAEAAAHFELGHHLHRAGDVERARVHFREAHRLQPDNWTYKRQAWELVDPMRQGHTEYYDGSWLEDIKGIGAENYYPPFVA